MFHKYNDMFEDHIQYKTELIDIKNHLRSCNYELSLSCKIWFEV